MPRTSAAALFSLVLALGLACSPDDQEDDAATEGSGDAGVGSDAATPNRGPIGVDVAACPSGLLAGETDFLSGGVCLPAFESWACREGWTRDSADRNRGRAA